MQSYYWIKTFHIVFVVAWMATVFYLPRILVNLAETAGQPAVSERLQLMGLRLYRFGHSMFGLAFLLGLVLWLGYKVIPDFPTMVAPGGAGWLHAKLGLVLLLVYFGWTGRLLKGVAGPGAAVVARAALDQRDPAAGVHSHRVAGAGRRSEGLRLTASTPCVDAVRRRANARLFHFCNHLVLPASGRPYRA